MTDGAIQAAAEFWHVLGEMSPYLLFGFLVAGLLSVVISPDAVERHLGGHGLLPVLKAAAFGVPLPLCSCGVVPVAASLRRHGASRGATAAFLLSTPQTGVDSVMVTLGLLGPVFAIFRPLAALAIGVVGGQLVQLAGSGEAGDSSAVEPCSEACCSGHSGRSWLVRVLRYGFVTLPRDIGKPLLVGLAVAGGLSALLPDDCFGRLLGRGLLGMVAMMAVGIPLYVCATASVPIAAALIAKGLSPGAALVFLMTGPATNAAGIAMVWKLLGRRATLVYLAVVALSALGCGLLLDGIMDAVPAAAAQAPGWMLPESVKTASAVALLGLLAIVLTRRNGRSQV